MTGKASIVVLSHNRPDYTRECLRSIYKKTEHPDYEVILVDDGVNQDTSAILQSFVDTRPFTCLISTEGNQGVAHKLNIGAAEASGAFLVFLNSHSAVTQGWLSRAIQHLQSVEIGLVGPATNALGFENHIKAAYNHLGDLDEFAERYTEAHEGEIVSIENVPFFCVVMRRETFNKTGLLDDTFTTEAAAGDDYALRLHQEGFKCVYAKDVFVHYWSFTDLSEADLVAYWDAIQSDHAAFTAKWGRDWQPNRYRESLTVEQIAPDSETKLRLAALILERDQTIAHLNRDIAIQEEDLARSRLILNDIRTSTSWRAMQIIFAIRHRLAPEGSTRDRVLGWFVGVLKGMARLAKRTWEKLQIKMLLFRNSSAKEVVIMIPTLTWKAPLFQRPHQLALALARQGNLVIYCEPPYSGFFEPGIHKIDEKLFVVVKERFEILKAVPSPITFVLVYNTKYIPDLSKPRIVYEYIDELSVFPGDLEELLQVHNELVRSADVVVATANKLYQELLPIRDDTLYCPNGVDYDFIRRTMAETNVPPEELKAFVEQGTPIIGYYGALAEWFDYDLLIQAAKTRPNYQFILIGPDYDGSVESTALAKQPNIKWLGVKPYFELHRYLKYFDVTTVPFVLNEITHSTSPLKLFEYMAGGKPIVTTAMRECTKYPVVLIAQDAQDYIVKLDEALSLRDDPKYLESLEQTARENTWDIRAQQILDAFSANAGPNRR